MSTGIILALLGVFFIGWFIGAVFSVPPVTGPSMDSARDSVAAALVGLVVVMIVALTRFLVLL